MRRESLQLIDTPADWALVPKDAAAEPVLDRAPAALLVPVVVPAVESVHDAQSQMQSPNAPVGGSLDGVDRPAIHGAQDIHHSQVAMDAQGNALAVWMQYDGARTVIWANRYTAGAGWGTAVRIEASSADNASDPQIAINADGDAIVLWRQVQGADFTIWANHYRAGAGWGVAALIERLHRDSVWEARCPRLALGAGGEAMAVWRQFDGARTDIWAKRYAAPSGWGQAQLVQSSTAGHADRPRVATQAAGHAVAVWQQFDGVCTSVWACRFAPGLGWQRAERIETPANGGSYNPQVAIDDQGKALVVWEQYDGTRWSICASRSRPDTGWGAVHWIEADAVGHAASPQVAMDARGNALASWSHREGAGGGVWTCRYVAGQGWLAPQLVESKALGSVHEPQISLAANGQAVAVWWMSEPLSGRSMHCSRYLPDLGWSPAVELDVNQTGGVLIPQMLVDTQGAVIAVWRQQDATSDSVWGHAMS